VVITENGVAELAGKTVRERVELLAGLCHPDFRDAYLEEARRILTI
jgi:acyl-CoA hydrolase